MADKGGRIDPEGPLIIEERQGRRRRRFRGHLARSHPLLRALSEALFRRARHLEGEQVVAFFGSPGGLSMLVLRAVSCARGTKRGHGGPVVALGLRFIFVCRDGASPIRNFGAPARGAGARYDQRGGGRRGD